MDLLKALKSKGRTVQELADLTGMSRGGVIQALRRNKKLIKKVGSKREHERGPESTLYQLKANAVIKEKPKGRPKAKKPADGLAQGVVEAPANAAALSDVTTAGDALEVPPSPAPAVEEAGAQDVVPSEAANTNTEAAIEAGEKTPDEA